MQSFNKKFYIAISCMAFCVLVFASFCNRNPLDGDLSSQTGTVILKTAPLDSIAAKEAKTEAISSMKATILSQGTQIATQTKNKEAGSTNAQFTFTNLEPASNLTALVQVFDGSNEKYRAESQSFSIGAGQTIPVTLGSWSVSFDQTQSDFTVDPSSIPADGITTATVKLIPRYSGGTAMGSGMTVTFQSTLGTWVDNVAYNSSDQSYIRLIKSSSTGAATISASIKAGTANATTLTRTLSLSFMANLNITSDSILAAGAVGLPYSVPLTVSGGTSPYSWSLQSGSLPGGLSLSNAGVISGTPTASGAFKFTVKIEDSGNPKRNTTKSFTIAISSQLQITSTSPLAGGAPGISYSATLVATGGTSPYTWSRTSGSLPGGLALSGAGVISGTPTASGTLTFTVKVEDSGDPKQSETKDFTITVSSTLQIVTTTPLDTGTVGSAYSVSLTAAGGTTPYTWSLQSGNLPGGLSLSSAGSISGTPTASETFSLTVKVEDAGNPKQSTTKIFIITILSQIQITSTSPLNGGIVDSSYSNSLNASGGTSPYTWSRASGSLPGGLSLSSVGIISGTPTTAGTFTFTVKVEDSGNPKQNNTKDFTITITPPLQITTESPLPGGVPNTSYSVTITASGGTTPYTWSLFSGSLPAGLSLSSAGVISGTPTATGAFTFMVKVADSENPQQSTTKEFEIEITVLSGLQIVTTSPLAGGTVDTPYPSVMWVAAGGISPYTWSLQSGSLPGGLIFSGAGVISGTPTASGTFTFTVKVEDSGNPKQSETKEFEITISSSHPVEPEMVFVPAGSFHMGDNFTEGQLDERPVHTVYLNAYYIGKYEVTNAEYKNFIDDGGYTTQAYWTAGGFDVNKSRPYYWTDATYRGGGIAGNENFPVIGVNWYESMAYCKWLSAKTGKNYRLPTEAEWEKAARGTDQRRYPWGNNGDGSYANYRNSGDPYDNGSTPVGYYDGSAHGVFTTHDNASPYVAYDMAGNVWEWCYDWYSSNYYVSSPTNNPTGPSSGDTRVLRDDSWDDYSYGLGYLRSAGRGKDYPSSGSYSGGFRCVRDN